MWKDCETETDYLDFDYLISVLKNIIADDSLLPASIGVYGDWGCGKSSLIKMSINDFEKQKNVDEYEDNG
jgi:predicted KAP-like P-loop ATPase